MLCRSKADCAVLPWSSTAGGTRPRAVLMAPCRLLGGLWGLVQYVSLKIRLFVKILKPNAVVNTFR